ncbi:uncharacterized protein LOC131234333 isoform X2 [Magnolia sinica]|uniref:uncharacterized protein LOC131234333 isoform X2 n=1 Tax=Magnolia sinica TaxID=86752 RepID=UPI002657B728|nr:uncharacterized protein LOC131234333 isoform X2 [Magnolia sinica]
MESRVRSRSPRSGTFPSSLARIRRRFLQRASALPTYLTVNASSNAGGKNSADRSLLVDLVYWVSQNPPPAHLFLISGDRDFANILHRLRMNNYNILLASTACTSGVLCSASSIMWHWNGLVRGDGLIGKHFNHPPDGVYGSWYGHYEGPLDDPYSDMEQSACLQAEDSSEPGTDPKPRPIPKVLVNRIRQVLSLHPEGVSLTELRTELGRSNVTMDKDFFGYKKFSRLLLSMPNVLKLQRNPSGERQPLVFGVNPKAAEPYASNLKSSTRSEVANAQTEGNSAGEGLLLSDSTRQNAAEPVELSFKSSTNGQKNHTMTAESNGKLSPSPPQPIRLVPSICHEEVDKNNTIGYSTPMQQHGSIVEEGFFLRIWRTWFGDRIGGSNEKSHCIPCEDAYAKVTSLTDYEKRGSREKPSQSSFHQPDLSGSTSSSSDVRKSAPEENTAAQSEKNDEKSRPQSGFFNQFVKWCKFWKNGEESPDHGSVSADQAMINQSTDESGRGGEEVNKKTQLENHVLFSKAYFWDDVESFLLTPKGSTLVSQSRNREQMAQVLQKEGPLILNALNARHLLWLVDLLISEKKWVQEFGASQASPFKLTLPAKRRCYSPSHVRGSNGLSSIFSGTTSQPSLRQPPDHEKGKRDHNLVLGGLSANGNLDNKQPQSVAELKGWFCKFRNGKGNIKAEVLKSLFKREFNRELDHGFYGCSSVESLLATCLADDDNSSKSSKKPSSKSRLEILADCKKLLAEILEENSEGFNMGCFKPLFLEKYGYVLDHQMLGYQKLTSLLQIMPGVKVESAFIVPSVKAHKDFNHEKQAGEGMPAFVEENSTPKVSNSDYEVADSEVSDNDLSPTSTDQDSVWEELGPVSDTGEPKLDDIADVSEMGSPRNSIESGIDRKIDRGKDEMDFNESSFLDEDFSDSEDESPRVDGSKEQGKKKHRSDEDSSLLQILDSWYSSKDGSGKDQLQNVDGLVDCSRGSNSPKASELPASVGSEKSLGGTNCGRKLKPRKNYSFISDSVSDEKEKLIDSILGSLRKSADPRLQS